MSHLSKIKTKINDSKILKKTLTDLNLQWDELFNTINSQQNTISIYFNNEQNAELIWDGNSYELIADSNTWQQKKLLDAFLEKIYQTYAYNIILTESEKQGFNNTKTNVLQDGSLRIVMERWKS